MAQKRMFSLTVTDTDTFLDMPTSSQALYFHLGMHGDDDGFVGSPKKIMRSAGCGADDLKLLAAKGFIIPFNSGVVVIRDWKINNDLKNDRYHETVYTEEKAMLSTDSSKRYALLDTECIQPVSSLETKHNVTKPNVTKHNVEKDSELDTENEAEKERESLRGEGNQASRGHHAQLSESEFEEKRAAALAMLGLS